MFYLRSFTHFLSTSQLCRELHHQNIIGLEEVLLEDKAIYMVFEYAEHDFLVMVLVVSAALVEYHFL